MPSRFAGPDRRSLLNRVVYWLTRRKKGRVVEPIRIHGLRGPLVLGFGLMELAQDRAGVLPVRIKKLAQLRAATRIGCPF